MMRVQLLHNAHTYIIDLANGHDISIPLDSDIPGPNCFFAPLFEASPLKAGDFVGDTRLGSPVNFYNVNINPHGNGTHTECVGHISTERIAIIEVLKNSHFVADMITVFPTKSSDGDKRITKSTLQKMLPTNGRGKALIIRTLPNDIEKMRQQYSGTNPPYFDAEAIEYIVSLDYDHLLVDLPSIDREEDGGLLAGHKAFWNYPQTLDKIKTITEMIYVPDHLKDGQYFLNIQIAPFKLDAAPSRILIYTMSLPSQE